MGWGFRKSYGRKGVRLNISKSGVGVSGGVKGFRISLGPRGLGISAGRKGLTYRKTISGKRKGRKRAGSKSGCAVILLFPLMFVLILCIGLASIVG